MSTWVTELGAAASKRSDLGVRPVRPRLVVGCLHRVRENDLCAQEQPVVNGPRAHVETVGKGKEYREERCDSEADGRPVNPPVDGRRAQFVLNDDFLV